MKEILEGKIRTIKKGMGFFRSEGDNEAIIIDSGLLNTALDFDKVKIILTGKNNYGERTGKVIEILKRDKINFVGIINSEFNQKKNEVENIFIPDNRRFYPDVNILNINEFPDLKKDDKILIELKKWENSNNPAEVKIIKILGKAGENETEMKASVYDRGLVIGFSEGVEDSAKKLKEKSLELIKKEKSIRKDLTHLNVFTIDPADAKDFDDALSVRKLENGNIEVGVHIADPSFFVRENDIIDREAQKRATSIYLVDRTIPMLPEVLSNDLCSLNPDEEKLSFSCLFELNKNAEIISEWFGDAVIISKKRFDYLGAQNILDENRGEYLEELKILSGIADILEEKRLKNGSIEFSSVEVKFKLDQYKFPIEVYEKKRVRTMEIIEEFMLLTNKQISRKISILENGEKSGIPFIYRTHEKPKPEKISEVINFLEKVGFEIDINKDGNLDSKEINKILKEHRGKPDESLISLSILRSMQKAKYSTDILGHYGLAFKYYSHFTSPIRRYPDMIAHRYLRKFLSGTNIEQKDKEKIQKIAEHSSEMEVKAVDAERASISFKQSQYYSVRIGEKFFGMVTGVTKFGIFIENKETKAQGMVNVRNMGTDFFAFDEKRQILQGRTTKKIYKIGNMVEAKISNVNLLERKIDLEIK